MFPFKTSFLHQQLDCWKNLNVSHNAPEHAATIALGIVGEILFNHGSWFRMITDAGTAQYRGAVWPFLGCFFYFPNPLLRLSKCLKCDRLSRRGAFGFGVRSYFSRAHILHLPRRLLHLWRSISVVSLATAIHRNALDPWPFHHVTAAGCPRRCCPEAALSPIFSGLHAENADLINVAGLSTTGKGRENNGVSKEID